MSHPPDDLEGRLDTAFQSSRPRDGFGDELWARIQSPARRSRRFGPAWARFGRFDYAPALSALLVVCVAAAGLFGLAHLPARPAAGGASSAAQRPADLALPGSQAAAPATQAQFGPVPKPALSNPRVSGLSTETGAIPYFEPADLSWTGSLPNLPAVLPVFRYAEPQKPELDAFATKLGATPAASPGTYQGPDFALALFGSNLANGREAIFAYTPKSTGYSALNPVDDAVAKKSASDFLAAKGLNPAWAGFRIVVRSFNGLAVVRYVREFNVAGTADQAVQIDASGNQSGLEVLVKDDGSVFQASGPVPLTFDTGSYRALPPASVLQQVQQASTAGAPHVNLTTATLVYEALSDGDHGFYVPAVLFTGVFEQGGQRYEKRLLVQVLDPSGLR